MKEQNKNVYSNVLMIPVGDLVVDENYQRKVDKSHVREIINNFDWRKVDTIKVSHRDGKYFVYDGMHTTTAILTKFGKDRLVACNVQEGLSWTDEARLFVEQDKGKRKVSYADKFRANYISGNPKHVDIVNICEKHGIKIKTDGSKSPFQTSAANTLEKYYDKLGRELFEEAITLIATTWNGTNESMSRKIITAVFLFVSAYHGEYKVTQAVRKWKSATINEIISSGDAQINGGSAKYARVLLQLYNKSSSPKDRLKDNL